MGIGPLINGDKSNRMKGEGRVWDKPNKGSKANRANNQVREKMVEWEDRRITPNNPRISPE